MHDIRGGRHEQRAVRKLADLSESCGTSTWGQIHFLVLLPHKRRNRQVAATASMKDGHGFHSPGRTETQELKNGSDPKWPLTLGRGVTDHQFSEARSRPPHGRF